MAVEAELDLSTQIKTQELQHLKKELANDNSHFMLYKHLRKVCAAIVWVNESEAMLREAASTKTTMSADLKKALQTYNIICMEALNREEKDEMADPQKFSRM